MMSERLKKKHEIIHTLVEAINDEKLTTLSKFLKSRIQFPDYYVTVVGETSSGKSTLINGFLKKEVMSTSSAPTTGTVVEVAFDSGITATEHYAINRDATKEIVDEATFLSLSKKPDDFLERLQLVVPAIDGFNGMKLFDTPGYGAILKEHEEILRDFIPNSDVLIYVIGYKIGIQENDFHFMRYIQELLSGNTDIIIVVNRCPSTVTQNDKRLKEITRYAEDLFHKKLPIVTVPSVPEINGEVLPEAKVLWDKVLKIVTNFDRKQKLFDAFDEYLNELLVMADKIVDRYELANVANADQKAVLHKIAADLRVKGTYGVNNLIVPVYDKIISEAPKLLGQARSGIYTSVCNRIDSESTFKMDETIPFITQHSLPIANNREIREYTRNIELQLEDLNESLEDYIDQALGDYHRNIELRFSSATDQAVKDCAKRVLGKLMENGLLRYASAYGGRGGAGAGIANAAKHILKKAGDFFGKKFSREFHNAVAHTLKKIGATSIKGIAIMAGAIIEVGFVIYDYSTWKSKLKNKVSEELDGWYNNTLEMVLKDLNESKERNCNEFVGIINEMADIYDLQSNAFAEKVPELMLLRKAVHEKLEGLVQ